MIEVISTLAIEDLESVITFAADKYYNTNIVAKKTIDFYKTN